MEEKQLENIYYVSVCLACMLNNIYGITHLLRCKALFKYTLPLCLTDKMKAKQ